MLQELTTEPSMPPLRVFLVENHADTARYIQLFVEHLGHEVSVALDLESALEKIPKEKWDVLISDISLPDGDGWQLLGKLGDARPPVAIAMSGFGTNDYQLESHLAGYSHHLVKPFLPDELRALLVEAAQRKETDI
jgi:DNA-binding response OmpR family regulator